MDERLRTRLINASIRKRTNDLTETDISAILVEFLRDNCKVLVEILKDIGKTSQGMRFLTLCQREDDPERWSVFLKHEAEKEGSKWNREEIKNFHENLTDWWKSADKPLIDSLLKKPLENLQGEIILEEKDIRNWRVTALRRCLYIIMKCGGV